MPDFRAMVCGRLRNGRNWSADLLIDVDFDGSAKHCPPGLEIGLDPGVAGETLAVELERLVGLVFDFVHEARWVVDVLEEAKALAAEHLVERPGGVQERDKVGRVCSR